MEDILIGQDRIGKSLRKGESKIDWLVYTKRVIYAMG